MDRLSQSPLFNGGHARLTHADKAVVSCFKIDATMIMRGELVLVPVKEADRREMPGTQAGHV